MSSGNTAMQQSSKAQDRPLGVWFQNIQHGHVKLPRFQRYEAWDRHRVASFLDTIIHNLPVGVTLALEVAGEEKFLSRYISTAAPDSPGSVNQHLLDGQQRLTAFWRSMHNNYEWVTFFVHLPEFDKSLEGNEERDISIRSQNRWIANNGTRRPIWSDEPAKCLDRGLIPIDLLRPEDLSSEVDQWITEATASLEPADDEPEALKKYKAYTAVKDKLKAQISELRERVKHFNLPYLSLPAQTSKDVALQVFINMNTNSKPLSLYDIIVAEVESIAQRSLHDLEQELVESCPKAMRYGDVRNLILATSALLQEKLPNNRGMIEMNKQILLDNWGTLEVGLERMANLLESQGVVDEARLPTNAVLAVLAAAYEHVPEDGDFVAKAEELLRAYLWSAFFTDRYENSAASRAYADFKALKELLIRRDFTEVDWNQVPIFNREEHPLADQDSLISAGWPKNVGIERRGILAVSSYFGANDFADDKRISYDNVRKREYHHIFPDALLAEAEIPSYLALNCALITWKTNRMIGRKDPLEYIKERVDLSNEDAVRTRLKSHLIPYECLSKAHYADLEGEPLASRLRADFDQFLKDRAVLVEAAVLELTRGKQPTLDQIWSQQEPQSDD